MRKKKLHRIIRYRDKTWKNLKQLREKISERYDQFEIRSKVGLIRKMPSQYNTQR